MDHAINQLNQYMLATIGIYKDIGLTKCDVQEEFKAYVSALNNLEEFYYREKRTNLKIILQSFESKKGTI